MDWVAVARKLLPYIIPFLIGAALAGGAAWMIQGARVDAAKADLEQTLADLKVSRSNEETCRDTNKINEATIGSLQEEVKSALQGCDSRLAVKDKTLKNLKRISELKPGIKGGTNEMGKKASSGDPILDELNRMYVPSGSDPGGDQDGVHKAADTGPAS